MATWYVDYTNGNNANTGLSFAQRRRTLTSITTAAAGDEIRIMKSSDPTSIGSASWTNLSRSVTIASGLIADIEMCETAWTASASVTCTASATAKQGARASSIAIAAAFATGKVAYKTITSTDFIGYKQVSFWIRNSAAIAASTLELRLCSDTIGNVTVDTIPIPAITTTAAYIPITYNKGSALGSAIQSVALYALLDPGTVTILLDNIIACKDSTSADSISLTSLIGKNSGTETWYAIKSISGTALQIDTAANSLTGVGQGYYGTTESVTTYKRETVRTAYTTAAEITLTTTAGALGSQINVSGGWNTTDMSTQTGSTWISQNSSTATGLVITNCSYINFSEINVIKADQPLVMNGTNTKITLTNMAFNNSGAGILINDTTYGLVVSNMWAHNNTASNAIGGFGSQFTGYYGSNCAIGLNSSMVNSTITNAVIANNSTSGFQANYCSVTIRNLTTASNTTGIILNGGVITLLDSLISDSTEVAVNNAFSGNKIYSHNHDQTTDNHMVFVDGGQISSDTGSDRRTASGIAWKLQPTSDNRSVSYPLSLEGIKIACAANQLVTVNVWCKRSNTAVIGRLIIPGGQISGVSGDVSDTTSGVANTYEQLEITFTPTAAGVVDVYLQAYGGTTHSVWFDDLTVTQA